MYTVDRLSIIWDDVAELGDKIYKLTSGNEVYIGIGDCSTIIKSGLNAKIFTVDNIVIIKSNTGTIMINSLTQDFKEYPGLFYIPYMNHGDYLVFVSKGIGCVDDLLVIKKSTMCECRAFRSSTYTINGSGRVTYREWNKGKQSGLMEINTDE